MRLISYLRPEDGSPTVGLLSGSSVSDLQRATGDPALTLRRALDAGSLSAFLDLPDRTDADIDEVRLLPVVPDPAKIVCVGVNYRKHLAETGREQPSKPLLFSRFADTQVGHREPLVLPDVSDRLDYEGELAVVIGAPVWRVSASAAMAAVAGYTAYNDGSVRDFQRHTSQFLPGKNFPGTGAMGPSLVTRDEVEDVGACELTTRVNGEQRQSAFVSDLVFGVPELIEYISSFTPLRPGDVIVTGTPGGVGLFMEPPRFLVPGDVVEVEIGGVGLLRNEVVGETAPGVGPVG